MAHKFIIRGNASLSIKAAFFVQTVPEAAAVTRDVSFSTVEDYCVARVNILEKIGSMRDRV